MGGIWLELKWRRGLESSVIFTATRASSYKTNNIKIRQVLKLSIVLVDKCKALLNQKTLIAWPTRKNVCVGWREGTGRPIRWSYSLPKETRNGLPWNRCTVVITKANGKFWNHNLWGNRPWNEKLSKKKLYTPGVYSRSWGGGEVVKEDYMKRDKIEVAFCEIDAQLL